MEVDEMHTQESYVMGIDGGTESLRVGIFDLEGNLQASSQEPYKTYFPQSK